VRNILGISDEPRRNDSAGEDVGGQAQIVSVTIDCKGDIVTSEEWTAQACVRRGSVTGTWVPVKAQMRGRHTGTLEEWTARGGVQ
jgi:hypothetical protein